MTANNDENDFSTIRIWREDKEWLDSKKQHERQGIHEAFRAVRISCETNNNATILMPDGKSTLMISKDDPEFDAKVQRVKDAWEARD